MEDTEAPLDLISSKGTGLERTQYTHTQKTPTIFPCIVHLALLNIYTKPFPVVFELFDKKKNVAPFVTSFNPFSGNIVNVVPR